MDFDETFFLWEFYSILKEIIENLLKPPFVKLHCRKAIIGVADSICSYFDFLSHKSSLKKPYNLTYCIIHVTMCIRWNKLALLDYTLIKQVANMEHKHIARYLQNLCPLN